MKKKRAFVRMRKPDWGATLAFIVCFGISIIVVNVIVVQFIVNLPLMGAMGISFLFLIPLFIVNLIYFVGLFSGDYGFFKHIKFEIKGNKLVKMDD